MAPEAAFLKFFAGDFQRLLETTEVPGMPSASWDRKAAYLLWRAYEGAPPIEPRADKPADAGGIFD